jgi:hypothetical protein
MSKVKRHVFDRLRHQQDRLVHGVTDADLVEDIRILASEIRDNNI